MKYFRLTDDVNFPNRWYLGDVEDVDNWDLAEGKVSTERPAVLTVCIYEQGRPMDFTLNEIYSVPIVSNVVKEKLSSIAGLQFLPAKIVGSDSSPPYFVMLVTDLVDCVDEDRSEFEKFAINDPIRPDRAGQYKGFTKLIIDKARVGGRSIFRVKGFDVAIIISADVKHLLDSSSLTGMATQEV